MVARMIPASEIPDPEEVKKSGHVSCLSAFWDALVQGVDKL